MSILFSDFHESQRIGDGPGLASCLAPVNSISDPKRLWSFSHLSNYQTVEADIRYHIVQDRNAYKIAKAESNQWVQIFVSLWKCVKELDGIESGHGGDWNAALKSYKELCVSLCRGYTSCGFPAWTVPCMYTAGKYLRILAIRADIEAANATTNGNGFAAGLSDDIADTSEKNEKLQDAARTLQQMISVCRTDDSEMSESRKWGVISIANLLFKTYFKLNNVALTKHVIAMIESPGVNLPPLKRISESSALHTFVLSWPHMLTNQQLPSQTLLLQLPALERLFLPLCKAIKRGNLAAFDKALSDAEVELVNRRIYLTLERSRDLCMRNLFRRVYLNSGFDETKDPNTGEVTTRTRRTRVKIDEFEAAVRATYRDTAEPIMVDRDEVECFLANMIYKGYMKGYISREHATVVLSRKNDAFPSTGV